MDTATPTLAPVPLDADLAKRLAPNESWMGHIAAAQERAKQLGKPFLIWNGAVYPTASPNFAKPLCLAADLA